MQKKKTGSIWYIIWLAIILAVILVYPGKTSFVGGWLPWSMIITFGLMWVIFIAAAYFAGDQLSEKEKE